MEKIEFWFYDKRYSVGINALRGIVVRLSQKEFVKLRQLKNGQIIWTLVSNNGHYIEAVVC